MIAYDFDGATDAYCTTWGAPTYDNTASWTRSVALPMTDAEVHARHLARLAAQEATRRAPSERLALTDQRDARLATVRPAPEPNPPEATRYRGRWRRRVVDMGRRWAVAA